MEINGFLKKIENLQLWIIKIIIFIIPFIPLYVSSSIVFPYITGKNFAFRILVEFAAALWIGLIVTNKEYRLRNSAIVSSILIFTVIVGLADLFGVSPYISFWSKYERMEGYITILHLVLYFFIVKSIFRTKKEWRIYLNIFIVVSILVGIFAVSFHISEIPANSEDRVMALRYAMEYGTRLHGTIGNPPFLASYLLLSLSLALILILSAKKLSIKFFYIFTVIFNSIVIYYTASRGAILAGIFGIIIFVLFYFYCKTDMPKERRIKIVALLFLGIIIVVTGIFIVIGNIDFVKQDKILSRFTSMLSDESAKTRFTAWGMAWEGIKERPILGWGQENFVGVYTVNTIPFVDAQIWIDRAHNVIIHWLINAGILGLLSYLAIFISTFYAAWKAFKERIITKNESIIIITALIVYFIHNLFTFDTINTYLIFFTLVAYIDNLESVESESYSSVKTDIDPIKNGLQYIGATLLALMILCSVFYYVNYKPLRQIQLLSQIIRNLPEYVSFTTLLDDFNKALSYKTFGDSDIRGRMNRVSRLILRNKYLKQDGALNFIEATIRELDKDMVLHRHNLEYLTNTIIFVKMMALYDNYFIEKVEDLISKCMIVNPEYQWLYMAMSEINILNKDYERAFANVKKIVDYDPQDDKKQFKLALAAIYASKEKIARRSLENVKKIRMAENSNIASGIESVFSAADLYALAQVYNETADYQKSIQYYKELINVMSYKDQIHISRDWQFRRSVSIANIHFETALTYISLNNWADALKEAEKAAAIDPENFGGKAGELIELLNNKIK